MFKYRKNDVKVILETSRLCNMEQLKVYSFPLVCIFWEAKKGSNIEFKEFIKHLHLLVNVC